LGSLTAVGFGNKASADEAPAGPNGPLEALGLLSLADVPLGGVVRSLAACLSSEDVDEFLRRFHEELKEEISKPSTETPAHFAFAEFLRQGDRVRVVYVLR
jgi:hypothetical protein